jgi:hypothetical protein
LRLCVFAPLREAFVFSLSADRWSGPDITSIASKLKKAHRKGAEAQGRKSDRNVFLRLCVFAPLR